MAAPKGNKNAVGNKGGGHPTHKDNEKAWSLMFLDSSVQADEDKIKSGVYCAWDIIRLKAKKGDNEILRKLMDKTLAELLDVRGKDGKDLFLRRTEVEQSVDNLEE